MFKLEFEIIGLPPISLNGAHGHWRRAWKRRQMWQRLVSHAVGPNRPDKPLTRAKLTLVRYSSQIPDYDGLVSSFKPIIDGLKKVGILEDDNMKVIGIPTYRHEKIAKSGGKIKVLVEEVKGDQDENSLAS